MVADHEYSRSLGDGPVAQEAAHSGDKISSLNYLGTSSILPAYTIRTVRVHATNEQVGIILGTITYR